jgi:hypothetical protein
VQPGKPQDKSTGPPHESGGPVLLLLAGLTAHPAKSGQICSICSLILKSKISFKVLLEILLHVLYNNFEIKFLRSVSEVAA